MRTMRVLHVISGLDARAVADQRSPSPGSTRNGPAIQEQDGTLDDQEKRALNVIPGPLLGDTSLASEIDSRNLYQRAGADRNGRHLRRAATWLSITSALAIVYVVFAPPYLIRLRPSASEWLYLALLRAVHVAVFLAWTPAWLSVSDVVLKQRFRTLQLIAPFVAAIISELVQIWLPGHRPDLSGAIASVAGAAVGVLLFVTASSRSAADAGQRSRTDRRANSGRSADGSILLQTGDDLRSHVRGSP